MSAWVEPPPLELELWYGNLLVADLHQAFPHQGTWFAEYDLKIVRGEGTLQDDLLTYIAFCEDFQRRIADGQDHDFNEFDRFGPITDSASWSARFPTGGSVPMQGRIWLADGQASWEHPETQPSTEAAANEFWARSAQGASAPD